jgi:hypothetical protein
MGESIKVVCRFRGGQGDNENWQLHPDNKSLSAPQLVLGGTSDMNFTFDSVLDSDINQEIMYNKVAKDNVASFMKGFNGTIFAYGQSGSGKTFSMLGPDEVTAEIIKGSQNVPLETQKLYGIIPRTMNDIFNEINREVAATNAQFTIIVNYYEIYNERFNDLLAPTPAAGENLKLRQTPN